jgi:hypothetical protein
VWNEAEQIPFAFASVAKQTKLPKVWLWMEDGSTDETYQAIKEQAEQYPQLDIIIEQMPKKAKANFFSLGKTHEVIMQRVRDRLDALHVQYMAILDVDSEPCPNYFARTCWILDNNPKLGAFSGYPIGEWEERLVAQPMNSGKMLRWSIAKKIDKYWDFCPDTFYNIKALARGYSVDVARLPVRQVKPSTNITPYGIFRKGQIAYYGGRPFVGILIRSLWRLLKRTHGTQMLRGFFSEWKRGTWRCNDPDVLQFFGSRTNPFAIAIDTLKTFLTKKGSTLDF